MKLTKKLIIFCSERLGQAHLLFASMGLLLWIFVDLSSFFKLADNRLDLTHFWGLTYYVLLACAFVLLCLSSLIGCISLVAKLLTLYFIRLDSNLNLGSNASASYIPSTYTKLAKFACVTTALSLSVIGLMCGLIRRVDHWEDAADYGGFFAILLILFTLLACPACISMLSYFMLRFSAWLTPRFVGASFINSFIFHFLLFSVSITFQILSYGYLFLH